MIVSFIERIALQEDISFRKHFVKNGLSEISNFIN